MKEQDLILQFLWVLSPRVQGDDGSVPADHPKRPRHEDEDRGEGAQPFQKWGFQPLSLRANFPVSSSHLLFAAVHCV